MSFVDTSIDVVIVGAGPAGAWAALELARAGRSVQVIEKCHFPRPKVCGGCLSGPAVERLKRVVGGDGVLPGVEVSQIEFFIGEYRTSTQPRGATRLAARALLDQWLVGRAVAAGAGVRFGESAQVQRGKAGWRVQVGEETIEAGHVLVACGLGRVPRELGIGSRNRGDQMVAQQWIEPLRSDLPAPGAVELHWLHGGYVGLATPDDSGCVIAMAADRSVVQAAGVLEGLRRRNPRATIWDRIRSDAAREHGARGAAAFPWFPDRLGCDNVLLIGDAAGYAEPFSGTGISQAMKSAECAVRAIVGGGPCLSRYTALMREHRRRVAKTRMVSRLLGTRLAHLLLRTRIGPAERCVERWVRRVHVQESL